MPGSPFSQSDSSLKNDRLINRLLPDLATIFALIDPMGARGGLLPHRKKRPSGALLIVEGDDRGDPALSKWSLGFNSRLVLGSPRGEVQQK